MGLSSFERETIVRWSDGDEPLTVFTHREQKARSLIRAGGVLKRESKIEGRVVAWTVECPKEWFRWPKKRREQSEAQKSASVTALQIARQTRKASGLGEPEP